MVKSIIFIILTYFFIYNPVFSFLPSVDSLMLLYPFLLLFLLKGYMHVISKFRRIMVIWGILFVYIILWTIAGGDSLYIIRWGGYLIEAVLVSFIWSFLLVKNKVDVTRLLLIVSSIAAIITCFCVLLPSFDSIIRNIQIEYTEANSFQLIRSFGLSQGLNFEFGIVQGLLFGIGLFNINRYKWYALFMPLVIISILVNARTGFLVVILSVLTYIVYRKQFIIPFCSVAFLTIAFFFLRKYIPDETYAWIEEFFFQMEDALFGTNKAQFNTAEVLTGQMLIWPKDFSSWLLGTGHSLFRPESGMNSDVGYVNQIAYGGLIYLFMIVYLFYITIHKCYKFIPRMLFSFIVVTALLVNIKGSVFGMNSGIVRVISLFSFTSFFIYQNKKTSSLKNETFVCKYSIPKGNL